MTKLCPRGKAAAKRKFKVYPSAYANAYASKICAGKIKDPSGVKRKDFKGRKPSAEGGRAGDGPLRERARYGERSRQKVSERKEKVDRMNKAGSALRNTTKFKPRRDMRGSDKLKQINKAGSGKRPKLFEEGGGVYKAGGGVAEAAERLRRQGLKRGGIAKGCGAVMSNRRKTTKVF